MGLRAVSIATGLLAVLLALMPSDVQALGEQEADVRSAFADAPVMIAIARCESKFTQFGKGGTALHGGMGGKMIGIFQVYGDIHADYANARGMDVYTTEGNIAYARYLYEREGTKPWLSSFHCWEKESVSPENVATTIVASSSVATNTTSTQSNANTSITVDLSLGREHPQVRTLQKLLNTNGFVLTSDGPGSPGNETERYGALTRDAVRRFQCAQKIICEGDEYSSGYGFVGARTRAALTPLSSTPMTALSPSPQAPVVSVSGDTEIVRLQAQIAELTKVLAELLAQRTS